MILKKGKNYNKALFLLVAFIAVIIWRIFFDIHDIVIVDYSFID